MDRNGQQMLFREAEAEEIISARRIYIRALIHRLKMVVAIIWKIVFAATNLTQWNPSKDEQCNG
jgi:hypothetical protein